MELHQTLDSFCSLPEELEACQGQGLVAALKEVPAFFFSDSFDFDSADLWKDMPSVDDKVAQSKYIEKLAQYLVSDGVADVSGLNEVDRQAKPLVGELWTRKNSMRLLLTGDGRVATHAGKRFAGDLLL